MLMRAICGLIRPSEGRIVIDSKEQRKNFSYPSDLGMLIETPSFLPDFPGSENLELLASIQSKIKAVDVRQSLERVGLDLYNKRKTHKCSLEIHRRLGIACAVMEKPQLLRTL